MDRLRECIERCFQQRYADNENDVPSWNNLCVHKSNCFACTPFRTIAVMRLADVFAYDEATACPSRSIARGIQDQQWMRPRFSFAAHTPELSRAPQPLVTPHRETRDRGPGALWAIGGR